MTNLDARTILVADDQPSMRLLVMAALASERLRIVEACDGNAAWHVAKDQHPALAIVDIHMPGRSGLELTQAIRDDPELADMRVIVLTGSTDQTRLGLEVGADLYLTKPFSPMQLQAAVHRLLAGA